MKVRSIGCTLVAIALGTGCASVPTTPVEPPPAAPRALLFPAPAPPPPKPEDPAELGPFRLETRGNALVGRIGASVGVVLSAADRARGVRDVVLLTCLYQKLHAVESIERRAHAQRTTLRDGLLEDDAATLAAYRELEGLDVQARAVAVQATSCVGADRAEMTGAQYAVRLEHLERRIDDSKEQIRRSHTRLSLLGDTVLGGNASGPTRGRRVAQVPRALPQPAPPPPKSPSAPAAAPGARAEHPHDATMLIHTADLTLAVYEVDKNLAEVEKIAKAAGGYLSIRSDRHITVRVPREGFEDAVRRIEKLGDVIHRNIAAEDVTDQFVDLEMRLRNAMVVRARLEKLLETAAVRDAIEIQRELGKTTEEIERLQGKLKLLRDRIAHSTITVSFERSQPQRVRAQALLPFPWMNVLGLSPLLRVQR